MNTEAIFEYLQTFKNFPTYQFERRIDAFLLPYLETVFNKHFETDDFVFVFPEFPLYRIDEASLRILNFDDKQSAQADYFLFSRNLSKVCFVELKTDESSINTKQVVTYIRNAEAECGWDKLYYYYLHKTHKNNDWRKFIHGLIYINKVAPELVGNNYDKDVEKFVAKEIGKGVNAIIENMKENISFKDSPDVCFCYIGPSKGKSKVTKIIDEFDKEMKYYAGYITLTQFADSIRSPLQELLLKIDK